MNESQDVAFIGIASNNQVSSSLSQSCGPAAQTTSMSIATRRNGGGASTLATSVSNDGILIRGNAR